MPFIIQGKTNWKFLLIVFILAVIASGGTIWFVKEQNFQQSQIKITEVKDETTNWQTYKSEEYGFEIKYPKDWQARVTAVKSIKIKKSTSDSYFEIIENENEKNLTLNEWFKETTIVNGRPTVKAAAKKVFINGVEAYRDDSGLQPPNSLFEIVGIANSQRKIFTLYAYSGQLSDNTILEQMLSTFKFIEDETADWQTYSNEEYEFEIKYPSDKRILNRDPETISQSYRQDLIFSATINDTSSSEPYTGIYVYADKNTDKVTECLTDSSGQRYAETKSINGTTFFVAGENVEDNAMGGVRSLNNIYFVVKNNVCYEIRSTVFWRSIEYYFYVGLEREPTQQELENEQNWIKTQQKINSQMLSTFRFIKKEAQDEELQSAIFECWRDICIYDYINEEWGKIIDISYDTEEVDLNDDEINEIIARGLYCIYERKSIYMGGAAGNQLFCILGKESNKWIIIGGMAAEHYSIESTKTKNYYDIKSDLDMGSAGECRGITYYQWDGSQYKATRTEKKELSENACY